MLGCGAVGTISGGGGAEQISYKPSSTSISDETTGAYCTVGYYLDGKRYMIHGAVGNCVLTFQVGSPVKADFEFTGVYNAPTDTALLVPVYPSTVESAFLGATVSIPTSYTSPKLRSITLDLGNEITMRPNPNTATGLHTAQIVRRSPKGSMDPEEVLAATENFWDHWLSGTLGAITTGTFGTANNNQLSLSIPNAQYAKVGLADRDGLAVAALEYVCRANSDAGEDEWELIQT
jgi:hypothetical protein